MQKCLTKKIARMTGFVMSGIFLQCLFLSLVMAGGSMAQTQKMSEINLRLKAEGKVESVLDNIELLTDFKFSVNRSKVNLNQQVVINSENSSLLNILMEISRQTNLKFKRINETIHVSEMQRRDDQMVEEFIQTLQNRTINGKVTSYEDNEGLPGVNVVEKGTTNGTVTNVDGEYNLTVSEEAVLVFSSVGFTAEEIAVGNQAVLNVTLQPNLEQLEEIVVTAVAISRQKKEIGYAVQGVKKEQLEQKASPDVMNAIQGKIAGVEIISSNGMPGANVQVFIRGLNSALGNNQPLMVIDGVPMDNSTIISNEGIQNGTSGGVYSNRSLDLNPNDIESINVLKGPSAAALYGSRASNGVIMITTKKGSFNEKMSVSVASSVNFQTPSGLPRFQNEYGHGNLSEFQDNQNFSWGPRFGNPDYLTVTDFRGEEVSYQAYPDNVRDFFETGLILDNSLSISGGTEKTRYIFSGSHTDQQGVVPNSDMKRTTLRSSGSLKLENGISVESSLLYTNTRQQGTQLGNSGTSPFFILLYMPRSYDLQGIPYKDEAGNQVFWSPSRDNPYWSVNESPYNSDVNRVTGNATISYEPINGLTFTYRAGLDAYTDKRREIIAFGSHPNNNSFGVTSAGGQLYDDITFQEQNHDLFGLYTKELTKDISLRVLGGLQANERNLKRLTARAEALLVPEYYNLANHDNANIQTSNLLSERRLLATYAQLGFSFKDHLFLEFQGRNDWSSTLPKGNNSYFYPSTSLSWIFTEALNINNYLLNYGKFRANYARVGSDADPYLLQTVYGPATFGNSRINGAVSFPFNGIVSYALSSQLGNDQLNPEFTTSYEAGLELAFLDSRVNLDATYFNNLTTDQIIPLSIPGSTGYSNLIVNAGEIRNSGIELMLNTRILYRPEGFNWNLAINFTRLRNIVESLPEGIEQIILPGSVSGSDINATLRPGEPFGVFVGSKAIRDDQGRRVINPQNMRIFTEPNQIIGDPNPDWWSSVTNTFSYKGFSIDAMLQFVKGGDIYSRTTIANMVRGTLEEQAANREVPWMYSNAVWGELDGTPTNQPFNAQLTAQDYWRDGISSVTEFAILDATILRLRELSIGYTFPETLLENTPFGSANISFSGRNLWWYAPNIRHTDPENNLGGGNSRGIEFQNGVAVRNYGFNLKFTF
jgi:TonB-linked SusC/RagA family outer membrane protein